MAAPPNRDQSSSIAPVALRPVAEAVDTYVHPAKLAPDESLADLARGLSGLDAGLSGWLATVNKEKEEQDKLQAEADFHANNGQGFAEAVQSGKIPAYASKAYTDAYKGAQGVSAGFDLDAKWAAAYEKFDKTGDYNSYKAFSQGFLKENLAGVSDPAVLRTLEPKIRGLIANGSNQFISDKDRLMKSGRLQTEVGNADQTIDGDRRDALKDGRQPDYGAIGGKLLAARDVAVKAGMSPDEWDKGYLALISSKAINARDPRLLQLFDQKVPGTDLTYKQTPNGREVFTATMDKLEELGRRGITEERRAQKEAEAAALEDVTRRLEDSIAANPAAPIPEVLVTQGQKLDGSFRTKAEAKRQAFLTAKGAEDPNAVMSVMFDIHQGAGAQAITRALDNQTIKTPETLSKLRGELDKVGKVGADVSRIMASTTATSITREITRRMAPGVVDVFGNADATNGALQAQMDYRRALVDWRSRNPEADEQGQLEAAASIGAVILRNIAGDALEGGLYTRDPSKMGPTVFPLETPSKDGGLKPSIRENAGAAAVQATTGPGIAPKAASPTNFGGAPNPTGAPREVPGSAAPTGPARRGSLEDPTVAKRWYAGLSLESKALIQQTAAKTGRTPEEVAQAAFNLAAGDKEPTTLAAQADVLRELGGAPMASTSASTTGAPATLH